ncbi:hexokinase type 2-like isoform X2 [Littorina saxatilis]|uniref:hexokinase type 2-like isoform X2 n=1 Tax=Littorina saxatilis TaxID=31220 RepID=UPI0038B4D060
MGMELHHRSKTTKPLLPDEKQQVDKLAEDFQLSQSSLQKVMNVIEQEMQRGLDSSTQRSADTGMFRTCVSPLPIASESGYIMVFQLSSDQLTIQFVILQSPEVKCPSREFTIPRDVDTAKELRSLEIVAIMNDTVSTLVSAACLDPKCKLALYVGNGLNACYVENFNSTGAETEAQSEVINTELGGLWKEADLDYLRTLYDKELDEYSADPGSQILEKMVSWMYIGEIVRLVLKRLKHDGVVFRSLSGDCELFKKHSFFPEYVMIIEGDTEAPFSKTETILHGLGIELCTDEDFNIVRDVCRLVCERSAFLTAAGLAALINHVNEPEVTVAVDGILCLSYPSFRDMMHRKTLELVKSGLTFSLVPPSCDRSIGAARIAAASLRLRNTKKSNK